MKFTVNLNHDQLEKSILFDYKISTLLIRGKNKNSWIFWDGSKMRLKKDNVFEKEMDKNSLWKFLNGSDFEAQIKVELFRKVLVTELVQPVNETEQKLKVIKDLEKMMTSGSFSDVTVHIDGKKYKLHKSILSARSKFFAEYFNKNSDIDIYEFDDNIEMEAIDIFIKFIYTAESKIVDNKSAFQLLELSEKYKIKDLKEIYESLLETRVSKENAMEMFCNALKFNSCFGLKQRAFRVLQL